MPETYGTVSTELQNADGSGRGARIYLYDNLKFLLITCVVVGHAIDNYININASYVYRGLFLFIYSFHMPLFLFVAGLFHFNTQIARKAYTHIAIGLLLKVVWTVWSILVDKTPTTSFLSESELPWFMYALGIFELVTYSVRNLNQRKILIGAIIMACFAGYDQNLGDYLILFRLVVFFPFYLAGTMIDPQKLRKISRNRMLRLVSLGLIVLWGAVCVQWKTLYGLRGLFTGRNPFYDFGAMLRYGCVYRLFTMVVSGLVGFALICIVPDGRLLVISEYGTKTLQVYFWHGIILMMLAHFGVCAHVMDSAVNKTLWLLAAVLISVVTATKWVMSQRQQRGAFSKQ